MASHPCFVAQSNAGVDCGRRLPQKSLLQATTASQNGIKTSRPDRTVADHNTTEPRDQQFAMSYASPNTDTIPQGDAAIRTIAMPSDTNPAGDIFGGWLMAQMDLAAGNAAAKFAQGRCATIAVEGMTFLSPVQVGDEVTVWAELVRKGRTSMRFKVSAWRRPRTGLDRTRVTEAEFTFVALDENGRPRSLPSDGPISV